MRRSCENSLGLVGIVLVMAVIYLLFRKENITQATRVDTMPAQHGDSNEPTIQFLNILKERNAISRQLNDEIKNMGKLECQVINSPTYTKPKDGDGTTNRGGYCRWPKRWADDTMCKTLSNFLEGKRVASFGDGPGVYKEKITKIGKMKLYDSYDGSPLIEEQSGGKVSFLDLAIPQYGLPLYDWVVSLEVAEHIPKAFENIYVDNLARHAIEGIVNSWALPDQPGFYHVNGKTNEDAVKLFRSYGFEHDVEATLSLQEKQKNKYYKRNCNVYRRAAGQTTQNLTYYA